MNAQSDNSDDQELAKALANMNQEIAATTVPASDLNFEETPAPGGAPNSPATTVPAPKPAEPIVDTPAPSPATPPPTPSAAPTPATAPVAPTPASGNSNLDSIKKDALNELRPLVDKLSVPPEEKFDTYLLLLRSTDDTSLIGPAHEAAREIPDEARRAQALLDVIKEIDYLSNQAA